MMKKCTSLVVLLVHSLRVSGFHFCPSNPRSKPNFLFGSFDYEYVPPNEQEEAVPFDTKLPSSYPKGTPAGLRGEAVRSALRSRQCIGCNLSKTSLEQGILRIRGKGCLDFLNNKLTQSFEANRECQSFQQTCLLNAKGRIVDRLSVAVTGKDSAFLLTSPGHSGQALFGRLDPFIFPLDEVTLKDCSETASLFTLASVKRDDIQSTFETHIVPKLKIDNAGRFKLPADNQFLSIPLDVVSSLLIMPSASLPSCAGSVFTFCFLNDNGIGSRTWEYLVSEDNAQGPVEIGALEFETLRIEAGVPAFGHEMTGGNKETAQTPATPLELHLQKAVDVDKGCYLGQEGIAAVLQNPRGPPRTLYQVVFEDDFNIYDHQSAGDKSEIENMTRIPAAGDKLFVLGSNEEISVGTLTSVAEPGGTGDPVTVGLALVRRSDSIIKQMKDMDLEIPRPLVKDDVVDDSSGLIAPPPLDPLDGLEVIIGTTFTVGTLKMVPNRRYRKGQNMFCDNIRDYATDLGGNADDSFTSSDLLASISNEVSASTSVVDVDSEESGFVDIEELAKAEEEAARAKAEADAAAAEAKRKAEKMEKLRKRAEEAIARRKQRKKASQ